MPDYRLYRLDAFTGHITGSDEFHAPDDVSAVHICQRREYDVPVELWQEGRKVTRIEAKPEQPVPALGARRREMA